MDSDPSNRPRLAVAACTALLVFLYTKLATAQPPTGLPCQKISVEGKGHLLCWTVDDHPNRSTPAILQVLKRNNLRATFFVVGYMLNGYAKNPKYKILQKHYQWFKDIQREGHVIGNHALTHGDLCKMSKAQARYELELTQKRIVQFSGARPTLWRPPFMSHCKQVHKIAHRMGMRMVTCHVQDYRWSAKRMWNVLRRRVKRGKKYSIILIHKNAKKFQRFLQLVKSNP
jgi:peptidoglycan/xylan/chitin deacetylase (PgdA/CDA1 family)